MSKNGVSKQRGSNKPVEKNEEDKKPGGITGKGFVKGDPRINRSGRRPNHQSLAFLIRQEGLSRFLDHTENKETSRLDMTIKRAWIDASMGDKDARRDVLERGWGKVPLQIDIGVADELERTAEELGVDWRNNPALAAIVTAARLAEDWPDSNPAIGEA